MNIMRICGAALAAGIVSGGLAPATAEDWPTRNVTVVVPLPPGVASDLIARIIMEQVGKQLGHAFVIENEGAGGAIGAGAAR